MKTFALTALTVLCPLAIWAADDIKPFDAKTGLWETTSTSEFSGLPGAPAAPQLTNEQRAQLDRLPAAQRAQVEAMMKGRGPAPRTSTSKVCLNKDSLSKPLALSQTNSSCTSKLVSSTPTKQQIHMECNTGETNMAGDVTVERVDDEHAKGSIVMKGTGSSNMGMKVNFTTRWVSADCGDVKPVGAK